MGLLEKLKNTFFEEEYVEVEEKPKKSTIKAVKINDNSVNEEVHHEEKIVEKKEEIKVENKVPVVEKQEPPVKKVETFNYFDEDDFLDFEDEKPKVQTPSLKEERVYKEEYSRPSYEKKESKPYGGAEVPSYKSSSYTKMDSGTKFTPTPIISPIYGVLDKNYTKDEIHIKKDTKPASYVSRKNADLDSVRKKAFGSSIKDDFDLIDEKDLTVKEVTPVDDFELDEDNLLYDMTENDKTPSVDTVTLQDAEEYYTDLGLEYNIDYKDSKLEKATGRRVNKKKLDMTIEEDDIEKEELNDDSFEVNDNFFDDDIISDDVQKDEVVEDDEVIIEEDETISDDSSLEDNLFDLIDSMYEEEE